MQVHDQHGNRQLKTTHDHHEQEIDSCSVSQHVQRCTNSEQHVVYTTLYTYHPPIHVCTINMMVDTIST